ncbi:MAG: acyl carrier protein [Paludibacteraceae bacterium]|nr:acyl carrier protein [Paludibacteraceae bacterium]
MEQKVLMVLRRVFKDATIDETCSQSNCKAWDSMNHLNLVVELEMEFGISLEPEEIARMVDYAAVVEIVKTKI